MITIKIDFPAGRWHATAWGSHVNEGVPEWPPCPWRLCRALLAAWFWKHRADEDTLRSLIEKLAAHPPSFRLPRASTAHTRHYMPVVAGPKETKTKIFDTFVHVSAGESLLIRWDAALTDGEQALLGLLLENLSYLGRAESLVLAELSASPASTDEGNWVHPVKSATPVENEIIRLLAPQEPATYLQWADSQAAAGKGKGKKKTGSVPLALYDALQLDNADWKKDGWNLPFGSRWVTYSRSRDSLKVAPAGAPPPRRLAKPVRVARFAITSKVPPSITQSLSLAERFHQALCKILDGRSSPSLTGIGEDGRPLTGNSHVYYLPECDEHGYITHVTLYAECGFDEAACRALARIRRVWGPEGFDVNIVLLATGQKEDFASASPYLAKSKTWVSLTPFVPVRHAKATRTGQPKLDPVKGVQIGSPEHDCWRLLEIMELPVTKVTALGSRIDTPLRSIPCLDFQLRRKQGGGVRAGNRGFALRVDFAEPVELPCGLGYAAHFGLGLFVPVSNSG